jgi:hypothetical protein
MPYAHGWYCPERDEQSQHQGMANPAIEQKLSKPHRGIGPLDKIQPGLA